MRPVIHLLISVLTIATALRSGPRRPTPSRTALLGSSHQLESPSHAFLSPDLLHEFTSDIEAMATRCAIATASYYMAEFHDRVSKNWMAEFQDYKTRGFENNDWRTYLESMIRLDSQNLTALVPLRFGESVKVFLQYIQYLHLHHAYFKHAIESQCKASLFTYFTTSTNRPSNPHGPGRHQWRVDQ